VKLRHVHILFAALFLVACGNRAAQSETAIRQGIIDYLAKRSDLNLSTMQVDVTSVSFRQNEADATVSFRPKGAAGAATMQMRYTLERQGARWVVKGRARGGAGQPAHGMGSMPPGHGNTMGQPQADTGAQGGSGLPPGHPPLARPSGAGN
jgi:hypothetical protein